MKKIVYAIYLILGLGLSQHGVAIDPKKEAAAISYAEKFIKEQYTTLNNDSENLYKSQINRLEKYIHDLRTEISGEKFNNPMYAKLKKLHEQRIDQYTEIKKSSLSNYNKRTHVMVSEVNQLNAIIQALKNKHYDKAHEELSVLRYGYYANKLGITKVLKNLIDVLEGKRSPEESIQKSYAQTIYETGKKVGGNLYEAGKSTIDRWFAKPGATTLQPAATQVPTPQAIPVQEQPAAKKYWFF